MNTANTERYIYAPLPDGFEGLSHVAKCAWVSLSAFAHWEGDVGRCWPSQRRLGKILGLTVRSIYRGLRELRDAGLLSLGAPNVAGTLTYILYAHGPVLVEGSDTESEGSDSDSEGSDSVSEGSDSVSGGSDSISEGVGLCVRQTIQRTIPGTEREGTLTPEQAQGMFECFWEQFRRYNGDGRAEARREFLARFPAGLELAEARRREDRLLDLLNDSAPGWEENLRRGEGRFNPRMGRWLRRQGLEAA